MGRLELPASCSQSKRATNCATPGYEIFQLWSNMWSTPIFDQLPARGKVLSAQLSQGFPGFPRATARTWASRSQMWRPTNFAIPGYSLFCHDTTASDKNKVFSVCGHSCGQSRFYTAFGNRGKSRKRRRCKALRRFALTRPGYRHGTPKPGAIPTSLYPDTTHYYSRSKCVCPVLYIAFMESCVLIHH